MHTNKRFSRDISWNTILYEDAWGSITDPSHGTLTTDEQDAIYTPDTDFCGTDSFTYTITDNTAEQHSDTATVTINVVCADTVVIDDVGTTSNGVVGVVAEIGDAPETQEPDDDRPILSDDQVETEINIAVSIPVLDNDGHVPTGEFVVTSFYIDSHWFILLSFDLSCVSSMSLL